MGSSSSQPPKTVSLLGVPFDANSSYLRGPAEAPARIREALHCEASNMWTEDGVDLGRAGTFHDAGDLTVPEEPEAAARAIEEGVGRALAAGHPLISLGGDHSVTYPVLRAFHQKFGQFSVLHFDAHPDLYHDLGGRLSHACPFARVMEEKLASRLVQVGIRTLNSHQFEQAKRFGVEMHTMRDMSRLSTLELSGPVYISFDIDVLDPAFVPGISHYEPGGMSVRDVLNVIQGLRVPVIGADIVEYNPRRDYHTQSAMVCAKILKEITAAIFRAGNAPAKDWY